MRYRMWCAVVVASFVVVQGGAYVNVAEGGLVDWMFNCDKSEQVTACYPTTPVYQTMGSDCGEPTVCCQSPDPMVCPPTATYAAQPTCLQRLGSCFSPSAGSTSYRTTWKTVPVTSYRPIVSTDPVTGCPVTVMKPCTTYAWQADRRECGFFDRLFGKCDSDPGQAACCMPVTSGMPTDCNEGMVSSGCCGSEMSTVVPSPSMGVPTPAPYYAPSPPSVLTQPPAGLHLRHLPHSRRNLRRPLQPTHDRRSSRRTFRPHPGPKAWVRSTVPVRRSNSLRCRACRGIRQHRPIVRRPAAMMPKPGHPSGRPSWLLRVCDRIRYRVRTLLPRFPPKRTVHRNCSTHAIKSPRCAPGSRGVTRRSPGRRIAARRPTEFHRSRCTRPRTWDESGWHSAGK